MSFRLVLVSLIEDGVLLVYDVLIVGILTYFDFLITSAC